MSYFLGLSDWKLCAALRRVPGDLLDSIEQSDEGCLGWVAVGCRGTQSWLKQTIKPSTSGSYGLVGIVLSLEVLLCLIGLSGSNRRHVGCSDSIIQASYILILTSKLIHLNTSSYTS